MRQEIIKIAAALLVLIAWAELGLAQSSEPGVKVGENLNLSLNGNVAFGYSGAFGDPNPTSHGLNFGGNGQLHGFYYNPKFISFDLQPFYNRSQNNSAFSSLTNSTGFNSSADFFSGSHFPGAVSFSKSYDSSGQFGLPGVTGLTTHGDGQAFSISWNELLPNWPTLSATFSTSSNNADVFGTDTQSGSTMKNLNLLSTYTWRGFRFNGGFTHQSQHGDFPALVAGQSATESETGSTSETLQVSHSIPLNGQWQAGVTHSSFSSDTLSGLATGNSDGSMNLFNTSVAINPTRRLGLSFTTSYNTNLYATLQQQILQAGGVWQNSLETSVSSLSMTGNAFYGVNSHILLNAHFGQQIQNYRDQSLTFTQYGGGLTLNYTFRFLGSFTLGVGVSDTASEQGNSGAGLVANLNYSRRIHRWDVGASFGYSQEVQTLFGTYVMSMYNYNTNIRRRFMNGLYWSISGHGSHSGMTRVEGSNSHSEGLSTALTYGRYAISANYSQSGGTSIITPQGLVPVPGGVPPPLLSQEVLYNARSFGFGGSVNYHRWVLSANYSKANSQTLSEVTPLNFDTRYLYARLRYRVRKMYLDAGYTRFMQGVGGSSLPAEVNSYYVGISRWFNVF